MTAYVDDLAEHGWVLRGRRVASCHLIADTLTELHAIAAAAGCRRSWYQAPPKASMPHYDLTESRRQMAIEAGAVPLPRREFVAQMQRIRAALRGEA